MRKTPNIGLNDYRGTDYVKRQNFVEDNFILDEKIQGLEDSKQDKEEGKGLSSNDYTTAEKNKLASITVGPGGDVPTGGIIMWSGLITAIPTGWALCNGENGTPNLTDRFIVGAGEDYEVGDTGGLRSVSLTTSQLPSHSHGSGTLSASSAGSHTHDRGTLSTNTTGSHTHSFQDQGIIPDSVAGDPSSSYYPTSFGAISKTTDSAGAHSHTISGSTASGGAHSHTVSGSTGTAGSGSSHENRPPYFALAFIMKL